MKENKSTYLRKTFTPYIGQTSIFFLVTIWALYVSWSKNDWNFFLAMSIGWGFFAIYVFIAMKYNIYYDLETICRQASGGPDICIKFDQITKVQLGHASASEMAAQSSPLRRIKISDAAGHYINVSLRHFRDEDIRRLMSMIHDSRPNLEMPKGY